MGDGMGQAMEAAAAPPGAGGGVGGSVLPLADRERLGALLAALEPRLRAVALRLTRDPDGARDVVQSAFEKAVRHGARFRGDSRVSTWLHRIVANEALMWLRAQRRRERLAADCGPGGPAAPEPAPDAVELLERRRRHQRLREGVAQLSADDRDVVLRCIAGQLSYPEYARRTGHHPAAVKSRAHRARLRLHALLCEPDALESPTGTDPQSAS
jgi:RNA polymerase sigma-70 factor, ECF subfamily